MCFHSIKNTTFSIYVKRILNIHVFFQKKIFFKIVTRWSNHDPADQILFYFFLVLYKTLGAHPVIIHGGQGSLDGISETSFDMGYGKRHFLGLWLMTGVKLSSLNSDK